MRRDSSAAAETRNGPDEVAGSGVGAATATVLVGSFVISASSVLLPPLDVATVGGATSGTAGCCCDRCWPGARVMTGCNSTADVSDSSLGSGVADFCGSLRLAD